MGIPFYPWPSIGSFSKVAKDLAKNNTLNKFQDYRGKIKLHGTNAGITVTPDGRVFAQSRNRTLTVGPDDNSGFAAWVEGNNNFFKALAKATDFTIYGEWCGQGIMKKVAISEIGRKVYAVFGIFIQNPTVGMDGTVLFDPEDISNFLGNLPDNMYVLPWATEVCSIDFMSNGSIDGALEVINSAVERVEKNDPWVEATFGVSGVGEGLVYYPMAGYANGMARFPFQFYTFKAKGEEHRVVKTEKAAVFNDQEIREINEFADIMVTEARLNQAVAEELSDEFDKRLLGPLIAWMNRDIKKDIDNGEVNIPDGVTWKAISSVISKRTRDWYIANGA